MIRSTRNAGFTLLEMVISSAILLVMAGALVQAVRSLSEMGTTVSTSTRLQQEGERALLEIMADLERSGVATLGGKAYPHLFSDGDAAAAFDNHDHAPATQHAVAGEIDFGPSRDIVYLRPFDGDAAGAAGHGIPDIDANGELVWDAAEFSYVLVTNNGVNELQRRVNGANPEVIATGVERFVIDDDTTDATLTDEAVRVRIWLRGLDQDGILHRHLSEAVVRLQNG